jgi:predicted  nucleic acid-binding Zn-ribbon protein
MSEESPQNLPPPSFEERVLTALSAIGNDVAALGERMSALERKVDGLEQKVDGLEEKVDRRLQETRPIWESVQAQIKKLDTKFDIVIRELYEIRYDHVILGQRVDELEKSSSQ